MSCATTNTEVITIARGSLQRLISLRAVSLSTVTAIIQTVNACMSQGVDIQLKILQILLSLITNFPAMLPVHSRLLANLRTSISFSCCPDGRWMLNTRPWRCRPCYYVSSCMNPGRLSCRGGGGDAVAMLRRLVVGVDKVVEEGRPLVLAGKLESIPFRAERGDRLALQLDTFSIFEDRCPLGNSERPQFLQLQYLHKTFALELIRTGRLSRALPQGACLIQLVPY